MGSEVGTLRRVILHRPDLELRRLTPRNKDDLLFDDVLWVKRARQEHDAFADALAERGVEVLLLEHLLAEVLENPAVREDVLERTLRAANLKPTLSPAARLWLQAMTATEAAHWLIGGVAWDELPFEAESLAAAVATDRDDGFALPPLPNHMFTRDTSAWIYGGVSVNAMAKPARRRESIHLEAIYKHHPLFAGRDFELWSEAWPLPPHLEGGDILVIGNGAVLVGMGERTTPVAVELLAERLFAAGAASEVIAVLLPARRSSMHLDTVLTMIDRDAFTIYPDLRDALIPYVIQPRPHGPEDREARGSLRRDRPRSRPPVGAARGNRRRSLRGRARAVGRRQQRSRARSRRRRRVRAQRRDEHAPSPRGHRGHHDRRLGARPGTGRPALHVLSDRARRPSGGLLMAKVVVGVDGSAGAAQALEWAVTEAGLRKASLHIVHAWMVPLVDAIPDAWVIGAPTIGPSDEEVHEHLDAAARKVLDEALDRARALEPELEIVGELIEMRAVPALIAAAGDAELLVVGSRGRGGFKGLLLGSVSAQLRAPRALPGRDRPRLGPSARLAPLGYRC